MVRAKEFGAGEAPADEDYCYEPGLVISGSGEYGEHSSTNIKTGHHGMVARLR